VEVHEGDIVDCPKGKDGAHSVESLTEEQGALVANKYVVACDVQFCDTYLLCCVSSCVLLTQHMQSNMVYMLLILNDHAPCYVGHGGSW